MDNYNINFTAILNVDAYGRILSCSENSKKLLQNQNPAGTSIKSYSNILQQYSVTYTKVEGNYIYLINHIDAETVFDKIVQENPFAIFILDTSGTILYHNSAFLKIYNIRKSDVLGENIHNFEKDEYASPFLIDLVIKTKKQISFEQQIKSDKKYTTILLPILDKEKNIQYIIGSCQDISDIKRLEQELSDTKHELEQYKSQLHETEKNTKILELDLQSTAMRSIYDLLSNIACKDITILLLGKSGTGKTSLARKIHQESLRRNGPFITINCSSIPETLIESELFGYAKGAFTGASSNGKPGLVEQADKGTLFLDEIGELPFQLQAKLLELVQEKKFMPIGAIKPKEVDVRILASTNQDILQLVREGKFREDLYYRIAVAVINMPPLAERPEDIIYLLNSFLDFYNTKYNLNVKFSKEAKEVLSNYQWPGNIRELEHLIEFLVLSTNRKIIQIEDLPATIINSVKPNVAGKKIPLNNKTLKCLIEEHEEQIVKEYYAAYPSSYKFAKALSISQSTANRLITKYCK